MICRLLRVLRAAALFLLVVSTGCATATHGQLIDGPASLTKEATPTCADITIRRPALASRWGEFLRVRIADTDAVIVGQAKLKVGPKLEKEKAFFVSGHDLVLEQKWSNENLNVTSALTRGTMLELSLSDSHRRRRSLREHPLHRRAGLHRSRHRREGMARPARRHHRHRQAAPARSEEDAAAGTLEGKRLGRVGRQERRLRHRRMEAVAARREGEDHRARSRHSAREGRVGRVQHAAAERVQTSDS
ncbi:MAG: hypothetical protein QM817_27240 [Archangium sp.]